MKTFLSSFWNFIFCLKFHLQQFSCKWKFQKFPFPLSLFLPPLILKNFSSPQISLGSKIQSPPPPHPPPPPFTRDEREGEGSCLLLYIYIYIVYISGPILESKGMRAIFRKRAKKGKIFENLGKNVQNLKILWKRAGDCVQLSNAINC